MDVWIGGLAEDHAPGAAIGPLFEAVLRDQFQRTRDGDRFWYENGQFNTADLAMIRAATLADVITRNSGVTGLPQNVFTTGITHSGPEAGGTTGSPTESRTWDGYGNNPVNEHLGESHWPLRADYTFGFADGISAPAGVGRPNPRTISNALSSQAETTINSRGLTDLAITWGQFLDHDLSLLKSQSAQGTNIPIQGATIRVDAFPEANAVTDSQGFFQLEDVPAPVFFVHIDGSTAVNSPDSTVYPSVGKPFHAHPGQREQLNMGGMPFNIYLPPMAANDVTQLSDMDVTDVGFGPVGKAQLAAMFPTIDSSLWDVMSVSFEPGAARDDQGVAATEAVVIPVPPDRLPAPLEPWATDSLIISIQAPGATNFDVPARFQFPNVDGLEPGEQVYVRSFDHDAGAWRIIGTATVSPDGRALVSDPGVGILAPGWHGFQSGSRPTYVPQTPEPPVPPQPPGSPILPEEPPACQTLHWLFDARTRLLTQFAELTQSLNSLGTQLAGAGSVSDELLEWAGQLRGGETLDGVEPRIRQTLESVEEIAGNWRELTADDPATPASELLETARRIVAEIKALAGECIVPNFFFIEDAASRWESYSIPIKRFSWRPNWSIPSSNLTAQPLRSPSLPASWSHYRLGFAKSRVTCLEYPSSRPTRTAKGSATALS